MKVTQSLGWWVWPLHQADSSLLGEGAGDGLVLVFLVLSPVLFTRLQTKQMLATADGLGEFSFSSASAPALQRNVLCSFSSAQRSVLFGSPGLGGAAQGWGTVLCSLGTGEAQGLAGSSASLVAKLPTFLMELRW